MSTPRSRSTSGCTSPTATTSSRPGKSTSGAGRRSVSPMTAEFATLDATAQAELVRTGEVTPLELVDAALNRVAKLNPDLNAVIHTRFAEARKAAAGPLPEGPFTGVPNLFKDLGCAVQGEPYHEGMCFL